MSSLYTSVKILFCFCCQFHLHLAIPCGDPGNVSFSTRRSTSFDYPHGVTFTCLHGYEMRGQQTVMCLSNGSWSSQLPKCHRIECPSLSPPLYGFMSSTNFSFSSVVKFNCSPGYESIGHVLLKCQADRRWTGLPPNCSPVQCPLLLAVANSVVISQNRSFSGEWRGHCLPGYKVGGGSTVRICLATKNWSGTELFCKGMATCVCKLLQTYSHISHQVLR